MTLKFILTLVLLLTTAQAWATTRYVSSTGNDANSCAVSADIATPKLTFASAVACLAAGDTLYIRSGTWTTQLDMSAKTGTPGNYITVAGYPGETVTLTNGASPFAIKGTYSSNNAYFIFENLVLDGTGNANLLYWTIAGDTVATASHHIILRNLEIKNWKGNGVLIAANDIQVINCRIHDSISVSGVAPERWYGVYVSSGSNVLIQGNQIYNSPGGGIQAYPGPITNLKITKNRIYNNNNLAAGVAAIGGLFLSQGGGGGVVTGSEISHNLVYSNGRTGSPNAAPGIDVGTATGTKIYNNVFYDNLTNGIRNGAAGVSTNAIISNNHSVGNGSANLSDSGVGTTLNTNRTTGAITDCTVSTSDFTQKPGSSCIDAGTAIPGYAYNGSAPDQGAFETFNCNASATVNENSLDLTCGMNLNTPVQPASGITGITALFSAVARTTLSSALFTGTDSVIRTAFDGAVCNGGSVVTSTHVPNNITDTSGIPGLNQKAFAHTAQAVTNNCGTPPPADPGTPHIHYKLDETSGTNANDESANNLDGTHTNGPTVNVTGKQGRAVSYAVGGNDFTAVPYGNTVNPSTQSLTICMGVLPDAGLESGTYIYFGPPRGTDQRLYLGWRNGYWAQGVQSLSYTTPAPNEFPVSAGWAHVCQIVNAATDTVTLAVNGVLGTSTASVKAITSYSLAGNFQIGQLADFAFEIPGATIDEVKLYTSALSAANIATLYAAWEPPSPPSTCTLAQVNHQFHLLRQTSGLTVEAYRALSATVNVVAGGAVMLTIQTDVTVAGCSVAERLRYNVNGGATFLEVPNLLGADGVAFYGSPADTDPDVLKGTVTCCLSGALTAINGATQTNADAVPVVPFTTNSSGVHRSVLRFDASAAGKTFCFKAYTQQGQAFSSYNPAAGACVVVVPVAAGSGF